MCAKCPCVCGIYFFSASLCLCEFIRVFTSTTIWVAVYECMSNYVGMSVSVFVWLCRYISVFLSATVCTVCKGCRCQFFFSHVCVIAVIYMQRCIWAYLLCISGWVIIRTAVYLSKMGYMGSYECASKADKNRYVYLYVYVCSSVYVALFVRLCLCLPLFLRLCVCSFVCVCV